MSEPVEICAKAMAEAEGDIIDGEWAGEATKRLWMRRAEAAITAMREPTEAMLKAGHYAAVEGDPSGVWQAMIDEALKS